MRVGTHEALDPLVPPTGQTMSTNLVELVCTDLDKEVDVKRIDDTRFELRRRPAGLLSLDEIARHLLHRDLVSIRSEADHLTVTLRAAASPELFCLEEGDYRVASYAPTELVLERIRGAGVQRVRALAFRDSEEEWRRFIGREVDVVPRVSRSQLRYLRELPSVKLAMVRAAPGIGLRFNAARVPIDVRRAISLAIHRKAVVRSLGYEESAAAAGEEDSAAAAKILQTQHLPSPFRIIVTRGDAEVRRAALVLEENLERVGLRVVFQFLEVDNLLAQLQSGEFEAQVFIVGSIDPSNWRLFRSDGGVDFYRYDNPDFNAAAMAGDLARVNEILLGDYMEVPIFRVPEVIAADARLCGIKPNLVDLSWLGDVHACAPGETE